MIKIKSLEEIRRDKEKTIFKNSTQAILSHLHGGISCDLPYIDMTTYINIPEDEELCARIRQQFIDKGYQIKLLADEIYNYEWDHEKNKRDSRKLVHRWFLKPTIDNSIIEKEEVAEEVSRLSKVM